MLLFNGKMFAKNNKEMVDSLFVSGGTCIGFYKATKTGFKLFNLQHELFAFVSPSKGIVVTANTQSDGKARYMFSTCRYTEQYLGLPESYMATCKACEDACIL
jgi:hypothetical protein